MTETQYRRQGHSTACFGRHYSPVFAQRMDMSNACSSASHPTASCLLHVNSLSLSLSLRHHWHAVCSGTRLMLQVLPLGIARCYQRSVYRLECAYKKAAHARAPPNIASSWRQPARHIRKGAPLGRGKKKKISSYTRRKERERREGERRKAKADEFVLTQGLFVFSITT